MHSRVSWGRVLITAAVLSGGLALLHGASHGETVSTRRPLEEFPLVLSGWQGEEWPLEERIVKAVGVDDYLNRLYVDGGGQPVSLYVGYYGSQRKGDLIHSPKNCLPGAGWEPVRAGRLLIETLDGRSIEVNEYLIEKGLKQQLVLYWYHGRGRVVASEYWGKIWMVTDAITRNRTDGALVRLVTPTRDGEEKARARAIQFAQELYARLGEFIPD